MGIVTLTSTKRVPGPYPAGRVCAAPTCETVLNRYNAADHCHACQPSLRASKREQLDALADLMADLPEAT